MANQKSDAIVVGLGRSGAHAQGSGNKYSPNVIQKEINERKQRLEIELQGYKGNFDELVSAWLHDFMNLVFGHAEETEEFWNFVILPEVKQYY